MASYIVEAGLSGTKEEASVGTMMPIVPVSGTPLTKESIDDEYLSLRLGGAPKIAESSLNSFKHYVIDIDISKIGAPKLRPSHLSIGEGKGKITNGLYEDGDDGGNVMRAISQDAKDFISCMRSFQDHSELIAYDMKINRVMDKIAKKDMSFVHPKDIYALEAQLSKKLISQISRKTGLRHMFGVLLLVKGNDGRYRNFITMVVAHSGTSQAEFKKYKGLSFYNMVWGENSTAEQYKAVYLEHTYIVQFGSILNKDAIDEWDGPRGFSESADDVYEESKIGNNLADKFRDAKFHLNSSFKKSENTKDAIAIMNHVDNELIHRYKDFPLYRKCHWKVQSVKDSDVKGGREEVNKNTGYKRHTYLLTGTFKGKLVYHIYVSLVKDKKGADTVYYGFSPEVKAEGGYGKQIYEDYFYLSTSIRRYGADNLEKAKQFLKKCRSLKPVKTASDSTKKAAAKEKEMSEAALEEWYDKSHWNPDNVMYEVAAATASSNAAMIGATLSFIVLPLTIAVGAGSNLHTKFKGASKLGKVEEYFKDHDSDFIPIKDLKTDRWTVGDNKVTKKENPKLKDIVDSRGAKQNKFTASIKELLGFTKQGITVYKKGNEVVAALIMLIDDVRINTYPYKHQSYSRKCAIGVSSKYKKFADYYIAAIAMRHGGEEQVAGMCEQLYRKVFNKNDYKVEEESANEFVDYLHEAGFESVVYEATKDTDEEYIEFEEADIEEFDEAANIDDDIKSVISTLNGKGYKTKYSSSGHPSVRFKGDTYKDGVKYNKLYSDARVVFKEAYPFPNIPQGWTKKVFDNNDGVGIYVKPPTFNIVNGMPKDQYYSWKQKYMRALRGWADKLPDADKLKPSANAKVATESAEDDIVEGYDPQRLVDKLLIDLM